MLDTDDELIVICKTHLCDSYLDGVLIDMRLTPYDVELQVPRFYRRERESKIRQVNEDIDRILDELGETLTSSVLDARLV